MSDPICHGLLDAIRKAAYRPDVALPQKPAKPTYPDCATEFQRRPKADAYKEARAEYDREIRKIERQVNRYTSSFNRGWSRVDLEEAREDGSTELSRALDRTATDPLACHVAEVEGGCHRRCVSKTMYADGRARAVPSEVCGWGDGWWATVCNVEFTCRAEPGLELDAPVIGYAAESYGVTVFEHLRLDDESNARRDAFLAQVNSIGYGDVVRFSGNAVWRFSDDKGWRATVPVTPPKVLFSSAQCCQM